MSLYNYLPEIFGYPKAIFSIPKQKMNLPSKVLLCPLLPILLLAFSAPLPGHAQQNGNKEDPALDLYYSANGLYNRRLYELAIEEYKKFLSKYKNHEKSTDARLGYALSLYTVGKKEEAIPELRKLALDNRVNRLAPVHNILGHCLLSKQDYPEAEKAFGWSIQNRPEKPVREDALTGVCEALYRQKKWEELGRAAKQLGQLAPDSTNLARVSYQGALGLFELKDFDGALQLLGPLTRNLEKNPLAQHTIYLAAECYREKEDYDRASSAYSDAINKHEGPFAEQALYRLGFVRFLDKDFKGASRHLSEFQKKHPGSDMLPQASLYLGRALYETKEYSQARSEFQKLTSNQELLSEATFWIGRTYYSEGNQEQVEQTLSANLSAHLSSPLYPDILFDLSTALLKLEKYKEAGPMFQRSYKAAPEGSHAADSLWLQSFCLHQSKDYKASDEACQQFLSRHVGHSSVADASFLHAENLFFLGENEPSVRAYRDFLQRNAQHGQAPVATFRIAQCQYQSKDYAEVLRTLQPLLANGQGKNPALEQLFFLAADSAFATEDWDKAAGHFQQFLQQHPQSPNAEIAWFKKTLAQLRLDDPRQASGSLTQLVRTKPDSRHIPHAQVELGLHHFKAKEYSEAMSYLSKIPGGSEHYPLALYYMGYSSLEKGDKQAADQHFLKIAQGYPKHERAPDANLQHALFLIGNEKYSEASPVLSMLVQQFGSHSKADQFNYQLGVSLARQQKWTQATPFFQKVVSGFPKSQLCDQSLYELAWCEKSQDNPSGAAKHYETLLNQYPDSKLLLDVALELSEIEFQGGEYAKAGQRLSQTLPKVDRPDLKQRILYRLGWCQFKQEDYANSAKQFEMLLQENPDFDNALTAAYQAGEARLQLKDHSQSAKNFGLAVKAGKKGETLHEQGSLRYAETLGLAGNWSDSHRTYQQFLTQYPGSEFANKARFGLGWSLENQKQWGQAIAAYQKVLDLGGKDESTARCQLQLGECHFNQGKYKESIPEFLKVRINFNYPDLSAVALLEMGRALEESGQPAEAKDTYGELVAEFPDSTPATVARQRLSQIVVPSK
jgi:TolA-binding protein